MTIFVCNCWCSCRKAKSAHNSSAHVAPMLCKDCREGRHKKERETVLVKFSTIKADVTFKCYRT